MIRGFDDKKNIIRKKEIQIKCVCGKKYNYGIITKIMFETEENEKKFPSRKEYLDFLEEKYYRMLDTKKYSFKCSCGNIVSSKGIPQENRLLKDKKILVDKKDLLDKVVHDDNEKEIIEIEMKDVDI